MAGFFDKLGKAAQQTAAEGRLRLDIHNLGGKLDEHAQALGHLMFRQHRGESIPEEEYTKLLNAMTTVESERRAKEVELEELRRPEAAAPGSQAPGSAAAPGTSFCSTCGNAIAAGAKFCPNCGKPTAS